MRARTLGALALAAYFVACGDVRPGEEQAGDPGATRGLQPPADLNTTEVTQTYAASLDVDLQGMTRLESGVYVQDLVEGTGDVADPGDAVVVHYTGWLSNGERFDTSRTGQPFEVVIGAGEVIRGWDEGVPGMRVGGTRRLVIPPALGYGAEGAGMGVIPPGATLVFEVELVEVR